MRKDLPLVFCSEMPIRCFRLFVFTMLFSASRRFCLWDVFFGCRQTIVKFSTELLYQVILCRSKNRNICVRRWRWPSAEPVTSIRIRWSAASSSRTEKSSVKAGTSTSAACMPSATRSRTAPRTARAQTFTSRSSRAATGDARRRAQTQSSSTRSAACSSAVWTRTRW